MGRALIRRRGRTEGLASLGSPAREAQRAHQDL